MFCSIKTATEETHKSMIVTGADLFYGPLCCRTPLTTPQLVCAKNQAGIYSRKARLCLLFIIICLFSLFDIEKSFAEPQVLFAFGNDYYTPSDAPGKFDHPYDVAVDSHGNIIVADTYNGRLQTFDSSGNFLSSTAVVFPRGVAVDDADNIYTNSAGGVAVDNRLGRIIKSHLNNHFVWVSDLNGNLLFELGTQGEAGFADGQFNNPLHVDVDSQSNIYVADWTNHRIQVFDSDGNFIFRFITSGVGDGQANSVPGVAVDANDNIIVVTDNPSNMQGFDSTGHFQYRVGSLGCTHDVNDLLGKFCHPLGVTSDGRGRIVVADTDNNRIQVFQDAAGNIPPVADAGPDQMVTIGDIVILDGSASFDADGDPITYDWFISSRPAGSSAILAGTDTVNASFLADVGGTYVIALIVNDGTDSSVVDTVSITANPSNSAPTADAGPNQNVTTGTVVSLDGSASSDPDGDPLAYHWSFTAIPVGSAAVLSNNTAVNPSFIPDLDGTYVLELVVNDGDLDSTPDSVSITAVTPPPVNTPPTAEAGTDFGVLVGDLVTLDGSASFDPDGDPLTYTWNMASRPVGSVAVLSSTSSVMPSFTADLPGTYGITLVVNDGTDDSAFDLITVTAYTPNSAPVADAGADQDVNTGDIVNLDASASFDPDGDPLTYSWSFISKPEDSTAALSETSALTPSFAADKTGEYVIQLIVNDGITNSLADMVIVTAIDPYAPVAVAQSRHYVIPLGRGTVLNGYSSSDPNDDVLSYQWEVSTAPSDAAYIFSNRLDVSSFFYTDVIGTYVVTLTVSDGSFTATDSITIDFIADVLSPIADAGEDQFVELDETVFLDGSNSSGDPRLSLDFLWTIQQLPDNSLASLSDTFIATPAFSVDQHGIYTFQLNVSDGFSGDSDIVRITADPDDFDGDGIWNSIDPLPHTFSDEFDNKMGTYGTVVDRGTGGNIQVYEEAAFPDLITIDAGAASGATFQLCGENRVLHLGRTVAYRYKCGSVDLEVVLGAIEVSFIGTDGRIAIVTLNTGDHLFFDDDNFTITNLGLEDIVADIDGTLVTVEADTTFEPLFKQINLLQELQIIDPDTANALTAKTTQILAKVEKQNFQAACNQANALINQVYDLLSFGLLSAEQGQALISRTETGMRKIDCN